MTKRVAVVGSSGGNLYSLGGARPFALLGEIRTQLEAAGIVLARVQFIAAEGSMDRVRPDMKAKLLTFDEQDFIVEKEGVLEEVNEFAKQLDEQLATEISAGEIDGLIIISADPKNINSKSVAAAAEKDLPAVGTGGTSVANAQSMGLKVVAASGTTGSTNRTRAVSYAAGLANHWGMRYRPSVSPMGDAEGPSESPFKRINFRGIMVTSLPAFIAMAIAIAISQIPQLGAFEDVTNILINTLPVVVAAIAATQVSGYDDIGLVAGVLAGALAAKGGVLGGVVGGIGAGILVPYFVDVSTRRNVPATSVNIFAGGISGLVAGLVMYFVFAPVTVALGDGIRGLLEAALDFNAILAGTLAGLFMWPAILAGIYHGAILPIILLEMETKGYSFLSSIDEAALMCGAIGITLGVILSPRRDADRLAASPGLFVLGVFGTFVEAAYPFMFSDRLIFAGALISGAIGGALAGAFGLRTVAYVPPYIAPFLSNHFVGYIVTMVSAIAIACIITIIANRISRARDERQG